MMNPKQNPTATTRASVFVLIAFAVMQAGCTRLSTEYGKSKGTTGRTSLNGFGALRNCYEIGGFRTRDVTRLSERVLRVDVIVWTPQVVSPVGNRVTGWFDRWLRRGDRTLVYIVPDSGSETDYWTDAIKIAPPQQRLEYRRRAARSINERVRWRMNRRGAQSNGWFDIQPLVNREILGDISGPWERAVVDDTKQKINAASEFQIKRFDTDSASAAATAAAAAAPAGFTGPTGPGNAGWAMPTETTATKTPIRFRPLLKSESGIPVVAEITSTKWNNSRVIVVSGGSLLTNYAFTRPFNRRLADKLVAESTPEGTRELTAGFLTSNWNQVSVSERKPGAPKASGMELLTVWPLSIVTMHGVMLGLVICLMLLPVFGRPRRIRRSQQNDFGDHLDAVAALMNRAGGEAYARGRISEYMKRMHGETSGPWVLPDPAPNPSAKPLPNFAPKHLGVSRKSPPGNVADASPEKSSTSTTGSLLDNALASEDLGDLVAGSDISTDEKLATTETTATPVADPPLPSKSVYAVCEEVFEQRMRESGLDPTRIKDGVAIAGLQIVRTETAVRQVDENTIAGALVVTAKIIGPGENRVEFRETLSLPGTSKEQTFRQLAEKYMKLVFPPIRSLVHPTRDGSSLPIQLDSVSTIDGRAIRWHVFSGALQIAGDDYGLLTKRLSAQVLLSAVGDSIQNVLSDAKPHSCHIRVASDAAADLDVECQIDGVRSTEAQQALRAQFSGETAVQGKWEFEQFFTMRPSDWPAGDRKANLPENSRETFPDDEENR